MSREYAESEGLQWNLGHDDSCLCGKEIAPRGTYSVWRWYSIIRPPIPEGEGWGESENSAVSVSQAEQTYQGKWHRE